MRIGTSSRSGSFLFLLLGRVGGGGGLGCVNWTIVLVTVDSDSGQRILDSGSATSDDPSCWARFSMPKTRLFWQYYPLQICTREVAKTPKIRKTRRNVLLAQESVETVVNRECDPWRS